MRGVPDPARALSWLRTQRRYYAEYPAVAGAYTNVIDSIEELLDQVADRQARLEAASRDLGVFTQAIVVKTKELEAERNGLRAELDQAKIIAQWVCDTAGTDDYEEAVTSLVMHLLPASAEHDRVAGAEGDRCDNASLGHGGGSTTAGTSAATSPPTSGTPTATDAGTVPTAERS